MATPTVTVNGLSLNGIEPATGVKWTLQKFSWWGSPASTVQVTQRPRSPGAWAGDATLTARRVVASGLVRAPSEGALEDALDRLSAAVPTSVVGMVVAEAVRTRTAYVQREDEILVELISPTIASWSIQMVATDPRRFGTPQVGSTGLPSSSGGLTYPYTYPYTYSTVSVSGQVPLFNPGNTTGPVSLRIDGPVIGPVITHVGAAAALAFSSSLVIASGEFMTVDMEKHTTLAQGQSSRDGYVTSRGWSGFEPGINLWSFAATSGSGTLTVTATPAWS